MSNNPTNNNSTGTFSYLFLVTVSLAIFLIYEFGDDQVYKGKVENELSSNSKWHVNRNVLQFSSFVLLGKHFSHDILVVEYLALFRKTYESSKAIQENVKCLVKNKDTMHIADITKIIDIKHKAFNETRLLWKVQCEVRISYNLFEKLSLELALVDINDFNVNDRNNETKPDASLIIFQRPRAYNLRKTKIRNIANCVHMLNHLSTHKLRRLFDWILIQKRMGNSLF